MAEKAITVPQDAGGPWKRNLIILLIAQTITVIGFSFVQPFAPLFVRDLGVVGGQQAALWSGLAAGAQGVSLFFSGPFWGVIADRYGRKLNVARAMGGAGVLTMLTSFVPSMQAYVAIRFFTGMFTGVFATSQALVASQAPRDRLAFAMGTLQLAGFIGSTIGPITGGTVANFVGYRHTFQIAGLVQFTAAITVLLFVKEDFQRPPESAWKSPKADFKDFVGMATSAESCPCLRSSGSSRWRRPS